MAERAVKRRRRLRYSMRTLLVLVTVLCIWLGFVVSRAQRQRRTVEKIRRSDPHSTAYYDYQKEDPAALRGPEWLRRWLGDDYFQHVVSVSIYLSHGDVTPDDLANLPELKQLFSVRMPLTDDGMRTIARLQKLEWLAIYSDEFTDRGLEQLSSLTELEYLSVSSDQITGEGLLPLAALPNLRMLTLRSNSISPRGLETVAQLANLETLHINSDSLTDECLEALSGMKGLTGLLITGKNGAANAPPGVTDEGLRHIARLSNLEGLSINSPGITDAGLAHLAALRKLVKLAVFHRQPMYTEEGVAALQAQLPKLAVEYDVTNSVSGQTDLRPLTAAPKNPRRSR